MTHDDEPRVLRVFPDWGADGVWATGGWNTGALALEDLPISDTLAARLTAWNRFWEDHQSDDGGWDSPASPTHFVQEGRAICEALRRELPWNYTVIPDFEK